MKNNIYMFSLASYGVGISGGDRIYIEFARRWAKKSKVDIFVWEEGREMCRRQNLKNKNINYRISLLNKWNKYGFAVCYLARIIEGVKIGMTLRLTTNKKNIIYTSSEFWMDSIAGFLLKMRNRKAIWVATWYQTAPNPIQGFSEGDRNQKYRLSAFLYWLVQFPIKPLVANFADYVLINNESEKKQFPKLNKEGKTCVVIGAVDLEKIDKWKKKNKSHGKKYEAVFQGRFHPQKGVVELTTIWSKVVKKNPKAKLAMIGDGPLMSQVKSQIKKLKLDKNIELLGYLFDGNEKYKVFSQSELVVHPAFFDSGGMASAEAMAFGIPAVGFNLESYRSYYPNGMVKVEKNNLTKFANAINDLLSDKKQRLRLGKVAEKMIYTSYSWDERAQEIYSKISQ